MVLGPGSRGALEAEFELRRAGWLHKRSIQRLPCARALAVISLANLPLAPALRR